jgi:hypothetical protein
MYIYKIVNKINGNWYIGKTLGKDPNYMGSGKLLKQAYKKYGIEHFEKIILETCFTEEELNFKEIEWITKTNALTDPTCYNLAEGGNGGNRSKFIPYTKIDYSNHKCEGIVKWYQSLTDEEKADKHARTAESTARDWYVSRVDDPTETYVHNISKWCKENGVGTSFASESNDPNNRLYQKQSKGWRIRRADMPPLAPYENKRNNVGRSNPTAKGRTWKVVDGKRVWCDK